MIAATLLSAALLSTTADVEVPFHMAQDAIIVDAQVNGRSLSLMFDTGFAGSVVVENDIDLGPATGKMTLRDFVGQFEAKTIKIKSLTLGGLAIDPEEMQVVQQPPNHSSLAYNAHTDGLMGFQTIKNRVTEINFEHHKFIFHPKGFDISHLLPDNKRTFLSKMLPIGHDSVEMEARTADGQHLVLALDTGNAFYATTYREVLERIGAWQPDREAKYVRSAYVASGQVDSWDKKLTNMTIFGVPVKESYWDIIEMPSSSAEGDGTVGIGFLQNFNIIIDYERRRVWLENFTGKAANDPKGETGISAAYDKKEKRVRVFKVSPESPASKAGVMVGDGIFSIDGNEVLGQLSGRQMDNLLSGAPGTDVTLSLSRGGELKRVTLHRQALVNE
jgi:hypothetical protein